MWDFVASPEIGKDRKKELRTKWWEDIILGGVKVYRYDKAKNSVREIVTDLILNKSKSLDIQEEMLTYDVLARITAGKYVTKQLQDLKKAYEEEIRVVRKQINELVAEWAQNEVTKKELKDQLNELKKINEKLEEGMQRSKRINEKLEEDIQRLHLKMAELEKAPIPGAP
ncbi:hypothetical protein DL768_009006 [Monosporascus sp. mg162]|nr:hypothetical protein DL768_009006 [Monosporascus sp. mg162]